MQASKARIDQLLKEVACHLGRRLRHADRPSAKSILPRQRTERQGDSESFSNEPGSEQA
jgi:hypothetical protein